MSFVHTKFTVYTTKELFDMYNGGGVDPKDLPDLVKSLFARLGY